MTNNYKLNHSMIRIRDPKATVPFYENNFGMKVIHKSDQNEAGFSLYFLAFDDPKAPNHGLPRSQREGILELTHNHGTESQEQTPYHNGNTDPRGFGHICFSVNNLQACCEKLEENNVKFHKKPHEGRQKTIAFALDPDNYWIELIQDPENKNSGYDMSFNRFNHTMIRIKDPKPTLDFYQNKLGMQLLRKNTLEGANCDLYFLAYGLDQKQKEASVYNEGLLELTHNYGTENDPAFAYHNGNDKPQGFGHIAVSVPDINAACEQFDKAGVTWQKRLTDGRMKSIAFIKDPDSYWVEVIEQQK